MSGILLLQEIRKKVVEKKKVWGMMSLSFNSRYKAVKNNKCEFAENSLQVINHSSTLLILVCKCK